MIRASRSWALRSQGRSFARSRGRRASEHVIERGLAALGSLAILIVLFVPLERLFPARRGQKMLRADILADACFFFGQYLVWNAASYAILSGGEALAHAHVPASLRTSLQ